MNSQIQKFGTPLHPTDPMPFPFKFSQEVQTGIDAGKAIVALESTIISHGMPFPQNYDTAKEVEGIIRAAGAVPATIAIIDGDIHVGLDDNGLEKLAIHGRKSRKCSRRDIALCVARNEIGATTVSGTMVIAEMAGIDVFVTGGIGGVHRGGEESMDVSADLMELGRTPVAVVCGGVKSILDIDRTLEVLETQGVPVITCGSDEFPAFFTRHSGVKSPNRIDDTNVIASAIITNKRMKLGNGILIAAPVPLDEEGDGAMIEQAIKQALVEACEQEIKGKDVTPFILKRVNELTEGASLKSNIALVKNNARVGAQIALELAGMRLAFRM